MTSPTNASPAGPTHDSARRDFCKTSAAALAGTALGLSPNLAAVAHAGGSDVLRVGLVGCGGRGTGAASQALRADPNVRLTAMADAFDDRLQLSLASLRKIDDVAGKIDVAKERQFVGFDAYQQLLGSGVDVVLLATPPHFRPLHLKAAVDAGKHVFAEKPVAVDAPGVRSVLATCAEAKRKKLSIVSGLCLRYSRGFQETIQRIHDGAIGDVITLFANDYRGPIWVKPREPDWTDMHWQMRNWYYFTWLSGDFNVEQHVHYLDVCAWVLHEQHPTSAIGMGGRQVRTGPEYGNIFDHHSVTYEFAGGERMLSNCRQIPGCKNEMSTLVLGTKGQAVLSDSRSGLGLRSRNGEWLYRFTDKDEFYQTEHDELFASIRRGAPINNGEYMAHSTLLAILGRMTTYTGQQISWEEALNSQEDLTPAKYEWGQIATPSIAVPGVTKFA